MILQPVRLPPRPRILLVALRRLGDVLLTTPLIRSIRTAWPDACIDVLVFADTAKILVGNPDVDDIILMPVRPTGRQTISIAAQIARRYDLSVSTQTGDRPSLIALLASSKAVAPIDSRLGGRLKRILLWRSVPHDPGAHRIDGLLRLADALGIPRSVEVVPPRGECHTDVPSGRYAVIHAAPLFKYKRWTSEGWRNVSDALASTGITVLASGGPSDAEQRYLNHVWNGTSVVRLDGRCDWKDLSAILRRACVYVGPDTSVTHLAAATGCPTVALFGPTDPRLWGPWPHGGLKVPWVAQAPLQQRGNVWIVQHAFPCTPCQLEGCDRALSSESECLKQLTADQVLLAVGQALVSASGGGQDLKPLSVS